MLRVLDLRLLIRTELVDLHTRCYQKPVATSIPNIDFELNSDSKRAIVFFWGSKKAKDNDYCKTNLCKLVVRRSVCRGCRHGLTGWDKQQKFFSSCEGSDVC